MKKGLAGEFAKYTSLNVLGMVGLSCYILADTYFISKGLGVNGLTALNLAIPVYSFIHGRRLMISMGGGITFSVKMGGRDGCDKAVFTNALYLVAAFAALFMGVGVGFCNGLVALLGAKGPVFAMTKTYIQVILLFSPAFMLNNVLLCFVRNNGSPQLAMGAMLCGSLSNVVLDYVFIFPCGMGIFGAVFATSLAPIISMGVLSVHFFKRRSGFGVGRCAPQIGVLGGILSSGAPSLITEVSSGVVMIVFNSIILGLQGNTGVAAYGVIANLWLVVAAVYTGIAQGAQPMLSRYFGAGNTAATRRILQYALVLVLGLSAVCYAGVYCFANPIVAAFNSQNSSLLQSMAVQGLRYYFLACPFVGINIVLSAYFAATTKVRPAHVISLLLGFIVILPAILVLSRVGGMVGVWCAQPVTELLVAAFGGAYWAKQRANNG